MRCLAAGNGKINAATATRERVTGSCHCGQVTVHYHSPVPAGEIPVRVCQCTFCRRHGGRYTSHPDAKLEIISTSETALNRYRFGTSSADFILCARCGVAVAAVCEIEATLRAVVNTSVFDDFVAATENTSEHDFDDETLESRLARRQRNWIPDVTLKINQ